MNLYLNNASTTPPDREVLADFMGCATTYWHNPSDLSKPGMFAKGIIENAQLEIANSINAMPKEIIFTSGASESNNWSIKGFLDKNPDYKTIISTKIEHPSVYETVKFMGTHGYNILHTPVDRYGVVTLLEEMIVKNNVQKPFVSIMLANNEIGTIQPIKEIAEIVHKYNGVLHVDATQVFMHMRIDVDDLGIDMMSTSFHKYGGFKNSGFLYVRSGIELTPLIHGGHQFDSMRAGTENVPMICAMGKQVERFNKQLPITIETLQKRYCSIISKVDLICCDLCDYKLHGHFSRRIYNNLSFTFKGINAESLVCLLEENGIYVSTGSACSSKDGIPSRVLTEIGLSPEEANSTIRISINEKISQEEIEYFGEVLGSCLRILLN